jgi:cytochrome c6
MLRSILVVAAVLVAAPGTADDGQEMYGRKCLACHALDGSGDKPLGRKLGAPDLRVSRLSQADIERVIVQGRGKMPPYGDKLTPQQVTAIAVYVGQGLRSATAPPGPGPASSPGTLPPKPQKVDR